MPTTLRSHPGLGLTRLLKWLAVAVACLLLLATAGVWLVGRSIPSLIDTTLASQGNSGLTCETNDTNLFAGRIDLGGLSVLNPPQYAEREFLRIRRLVVDVQPQTFVGGGRRVIDELTLDIDRVTLVGAGDIFSDNNATAIAKAFRRSARSAATAGEARSDAKPGADFIIRRLKVRVGGVTILQENGGARPQVLVRDDHGLSFEASDVTARNLGDTVIAPLGGLALTRAASVEPDAILDLSRRQLERLKK